MAKKQKQEQKKKKRVIWSPLVVTLLSATTLTSTGLAVYFALRKTSAKTYTITVNTDGGSIYGGNTQHMLEGSLIGQIPTPYKDASEGKIFDYWEEALTNQKLNPNDKITRNMTVKAVYKDAVDAVNVTLHLDGGYIPGFPSVTTETTLLIKKGTYIGELPAPQKSNHVFNEWQTSGGASLNPTTKIDSAMHVYAAYRAEAGSYLDGGSRFLQAKIYSKGSDGGAWKLFDSQKQPITTGITWSIVNKATGQPFPDDTVTIADGIVSYDGSVYPLIVGEYTAVITATKDDITASTEISFVVTESVFEIKGQSNITIKENEESDTPPTYKLYMDGTDFSTFTSYQQPNWTISKRDGETELPDGITIDNAGQITWYRGVKPKAYKLNVNASVNYPFSKSISFPITFVSNSVDTTLTGPTSIEMFNDDIDTNNKLSTTALQMTYDGTALASGKITWTVSGLDTVEVKEAADGKNYLYSKGTSTPAGSHLVTITGSHTVGGITKTASISVSIVSKEHTYTLKNGTQFSTAKVGVGGASATAYQVFQDDAGSAYSGGNTITWTVEGAESTSGITAGTGTYAGKIKWTTDTKVGVYALTLKAKVTSTVTGVPEVEASMPVSLEITDHTYVISGGSTTLTSKLGKGGTDANAWKLLQDGSTEITTGVTWKVTKSGADIDWAQIENNKLAWLVDAPLGKNDLLVTATYNSKSYSANVSLIIAENEYKFETTGSTLFNVKSTETQVDTKAWKLTKDGEDITSSLIIQNITPALTSGSIAIDTTTGSGNFGKVTCTNIPAGKYSFDVAYKSGTTTYISKTCSIVSTETFEIKYGDGTKGSSFTVKDNVTETDTIGFNLHKNGSTTAESTVTWGIKTNSISPTPTSGSIAFDTTTGNLNKLKVTTLATGTYSMIIEATQGGKVVASIPFTVVSEDTQIALTIIGPDTLNFDDGLEHEFSTNSTRTSVTWEKTSWTGSGNPTVEGDEDTGHAKVTLVNQVDPSGTLTIKATDTVSGQVATKTITITKPEVASSKVWTYDDTNHWSYIDMEDACGSGTIGFTPVAKSATKQTKARTVFNQDIVFGDKVTSIPNNFLNGCTAFNCTINFTSESELIIIGNKFLYGCTAYNNLNDGVALTLPNTVQIIGDNFLDGCIAFNNGQIENDNIPFALPSNLTYIGDWFMNNNQKFCQDITIEANVTSVGENFMFNCYSMGSNGEMGLNPEITINCDAWAFKAFAATPLSFACDDFNQSCYTLGLNIGGSAKADIKTIFPAIESSVKGEICRQYVGGTI